MTQYYILVLLVRLVIPAALLFSISLRPFGLSAIYLLLYLIWPLIKLPRDNKAGFCLKFLFLNIIVSVLLLLVHVAWHSTLAAFPPYGSLLKRIPLVQKIGHNLGLVSYNSIEFADAAQYTAPELVMFATSMLTYSILRKIVSSSDHKIPMVDKHQQYPLLTIFGKFLCVFLIMFSGILKPSVTSGIYYLVFMGAATAWSIGKPLEKGFAVVCRCLMAIMALHVTVLFVYQCSWITEMYPPENDFARYFGLTKLVIINETYPNSFWYDRTSNFSWATLTSPFIICVTYFLLAIESRELFKPKLISNMGSTRKWPSVRSTQSRLHHQDSTGSVILNDDDSMSEFRSPTIWDDIVSAVVEFFQVIVRSSYIATTITMMAWSIMFHSWLTFVLLMWANVVWLRQDQRSFMLKSSPVLVVYAMMLLLAQYIYGMDLTEQELPSNVTAVNLRQIGLGRPSGEPCVPLLIKSLFTCMFWVTLRHRIQDIRERRQSAVITEMAAPLQLTVSTAASGIEAQREDEYQSRLLRCLGEWFRALCTRYWIYVVVIMLFVIGITGERMTIFRIIYMFLFLGFILMFQISWYWWRRLMYVFWITVIIYSMINLIFLYIYQFDNFGAMIEQFLLINEELQHDLGLEPYHPADLFVKLLTPTLFLIITIIQVHYFHKDFMKLSDPKSRSGTSIDHDPESSRPSQGASTMKDDIPPLPLEGGAGEVDNKSTTEADQSMSSLAGQKRKSLRTRSIAATTTEQPSQSVALKVFLLNKFNEFRIAWDQWKDIIFLYLDIHLVKIILIALMLLSVFNVCAMHVPIMLITAPTLLLNHHRQRFCVLVVSTLISVYFMAKMVYQIDYIQHSNFEVNCSEINDNNNVTVTSFNNAKWVGFTKATKQKPLVTILKGYIAMIALITFYSLVRYRQQGIKKKPGSIPGVLFPEVTRKAADDNIVNCLKYLLNYGFYKFGVEITLMCLVGVIGSRMDLYAVLYAIWLTVFVSISRARMARLWFPFIAFVAVLVVLQYMIAVGFLPQFCVSYPWRGGNQQMKHVRTWLFLPYAEEPPHASKLIFDFFLLLFAARQWRVFIVENTAGETYPGGSNAENIGKDWETPEFVNPVPDFLGFVGNWLDVIKRIVFLGMLWVTLAIMFMTGTNRVNLFSIGYLIGSFIFLWQGTDFYLLPKESILQWWSWLLRYNVSVVAVKTLLQIPGCIFETVMQEKACWVVQLLGIGCVDKFAGGNIAQFLKMNYSNRPDVCSVPQEDIGLAWDGVCFAFLILQRRLFQSYYFYRVIDESKATTVLASRGAELMEELRQKQMSIQEDQEVKILEKIKVKMERIKANQKKIQGAVTKEPRHHDDATDSAPISQPTTHMRAVRSGDYYMFDEYDDTEQQVKDDAEDYDDEMPKQMGLGKLLTTVIKSDLKSAMNLRRSSAPSISSNRRTSSFSQPQSFAPEVESAGPVQERDVNITDRDVNLTDRDAGGPGSALEDFAPEEEKETWFEKIKRYLETAWLFVASFLTSVTRHLMRYSRDYRYVSRMLTIEKKILKEKPGFGMGLREGSQMRWEPLPETLIHHRKLSEISVPEIRILAPSMERGLDASPSPARARSPSPDPSTDTTTPDEDDTSEHESAFSLQTTGSKDVSVLEEHDDSLFKKHGNPILYLCYAAWYAVLAHTDIVCYLMVFINQIQSATILSIPLPLMVFLWGTLTIPRPTKTFWVTLIAYTEVIVLIKSMFQFEILPWNQKVVPANMPFTAPRIIGIERKFNYALYDLLLLLIIFLHRFMLKSLGLWKESTPEIELHDDVSYPVQTEDVQMLTEGRGAEVGKKYVHLHDETGPGHPLEGRQRDVQATIASAMQELGVRRSDPHLAQLVQQRLMEARRRPESRLFSYAWSQRKRRRRRRRRSRRYPSRAFTTAKEDDSSPEQSVARSVGGGVVGVVGSSPGHESSGGDTDAEPGPSKPSDDDHYKVNDDHEPIIAVTTTMENTYENYPKVMLLSLKRYLRPTNNFFKKMLEPTARVTADVYAYMFLCDFFNFLVVIFGFAAFGTHQGDGGVQTYLEENKVPIPFLVMLILQFGLIIIDRALYLRKFILGKILFQYVLVMGVHVWMFFVLPFITERTFNTLLPPPMWYMIKCVYLLFSAYQIRCGYPRRIIGNFLCKSYHFLNMICFRAFMAVPFVFELRTLMDWIWTDTSMTLMDWLKMEDIFASVYLLKCSRYVEDEFPQPRGMKKNPSSKYLLGGSVLVFVIAIIWFPLVFFAFGNTVGEPNPPTDVTVKIRIGPFLPVYQMSAQSHNIDQFSEHDYTTLSNMFARDRTAQTFLANYMYNDVAVVTINPNSTSKWEISPPELYRLEREVESNSSLTVKFTFVITHPSNTAQNPPTIEDSKEATLQPFVNGQRNPERETLFAMLRGTLTTTDAWINVKTLFPKFLKVFNKGTAKPAFQLMPVVPGKSEDYVDDTRLYRDIQLRLERDGDSMYWRVRESCKYRDVLTSIPMNNCDMLIMYTFNDKLFPETLNFISGSGIIGLYTTFVFLASRVIRGFFSGIYTKIMFDDLPNVDRVLQLCLDIYLVREALELALEEDLFAKLVFLYRSPETMIKWSRPKEEENMEQRALPPSR